MAYKKNKNKNSIGDCKGATKNEIPYNVSFLSYRYFAYIVDTIILLSIATLLAYLSNIPPIPFKIAKYYLSGTHKILPILFSTNGLYFIAIFVSVSVAYYFIDAFLGFSIGKKTFGISTAIIKNGKYMKNPIIRCLFRAFIKSLPFLAIVDALFAFPSKYNQKLSDRKLGFLVIKMPNKVSTNRKISSDTNLDSDNQNKLKLFLKSISLKVKETDFTPYFICAALIYYIPLFIMSVSTFISPNVPYQIPSPQDKPMNLNPTSFQESLIFMHNFMIDYRYYIMSGFVLLILGLMYTFSTSYTIGQIIGSIFKTYPSFFVYGMLPHFFPETFGYIFGLMAAMNVTSMIIEIIDGYFKGKKSTYITETIIKYGKRAIIYVMISIFLILIGAYIETYITSYLLRHYYYHSS